MMRRIFIYAALFLGALIFAWPFVWMAATSVKLERELFSEHARVLPQSPRPRLRSPYIDDRLFANVKGPRMDETPGIIERQITSAADAGPSEVDRAIAMEEMARGIYAPLLSIIPTPHWKKSPE